MPGRFAAGDVVSGLNQISIAMGQAADATTAIHNRLRAAEGGWSDVEPSRLLERGMGSPTLNSLAPAGVEGRRRQRSGPAPAKSRLPRSRAV